MGPRILRTRLASSPTVSLPYHVACFPLISSQTDSGMVSCKVLFLQGPVSINVMAGAGVVLGASNGTQSTAGSQRVTSGPRLMPQKRDILKTLV